MLCDSVGLGKTYIGLMLLEHFIHQGKRVLLIVPKSGRESVWERPINKYLKPRYRRALKEMVRIHNHTDFGRVEITDDGPHHPTRPDLVDDLLYYREFFDAIIVDEAHHFRTPWANRSKVLRWLLDGKEKGPCGHFLRREGLRN